MDSGDLSSWDTLDGSSDAGDVHAHEPEQLFARVEPGQMLEAKIVELEVSKLQIYSKESVDMQLKLSEANKRSSELQAALDAALSTIARKEVNLDLAWARFDNEEARVELLELELASCDEAHVTALARVKADFEVKINKAKQEAAKSKSLVRSLRTQIANLECRFRVQEEEIVTIDERVFKKARLELQRLALELSFVARQPQGSTFSLEHLAAMAVYILDRTFETILEAFPITCREEARHLCPDYESLCNINPDEKLGFLTGELYTRLRGQGSAISPALRNLADASRVIRDEFLDGGGAFDEMPAVPPHQDLVAFVWYRCERGYESREDTKALLKVIRGAWWYRVGKEDHAGSSMYTVD
ncbi:hypothetical protein RQP46_006369 [Phenoliferia psychrophenolica]